ncbi:hypothetical protein ACPV46_24400 [Photobacterium swingsii]
MRIGTAFNQNMALKLKLKTVFSAEFINLFGRKRQECTSHVPQGKCNGYLPQLSSVIMPILIVLAVFFGPLNK